MILILRFKQFSGSGSEFEHAVNAWLEQIEPDVTQMVQTVDDSGRVTIGFLFEESFRGQEFRLASERQVERATRPAMSPSDVPDIPLQVHAESPEPPRQP